MWATDDTRWSEAVPASSPDSDRDHPVGIKVEVEKLYGIRLGQPVKVRITTRSRNSVKISIDTLLAGKLQRDPSPWRLYSKPQMISEEKVNGFTTRVFVVTVAVWEPPTTPENLPGNAETPDAAGSACVAAVQKGAPSPVSMLWPFTMEFLISSENMANGLPKWQYMQVPCVNFGFSSTLEPLAREHGFEFGPLGFVPPHPLMAGVVMSWAGIAIGGLGCLYLIYLLGSWVRRQQVPLEMPANAKAYHRLMAEAQHIRDSFSPEELEYFAFRDYLAIRPPRMRSCSRSGVVIPTTSASAKRSPHCAGLVCTAAG